MILLSCGACLTYTCTYIYTYIYVYVYINIYCIYIYKMCVCIYIGRILDPFFYHAMEESGLGASFVFKTRVYNMFFNTSWTEGWKLGVVVVGGGGGDYSGGGAVEWEWQGGVGRRRILVRAGQPN